ncbi:MAG: pyruvate, phosphate dikinase [Spirochaetales bacterium]|nr:PEP/pyruvate-binding domain-containing protein [Kiritimatiellia bacterium]NLV85411.1 pyruvate, phosphate dikinase [Spirochaetales bacterium]
MILHEQDLTALAERAKELECVYAVDQMLQNRVLTLPDMMTRLTEIIPSGFSCPTAARVRISLWDDSFETPGFTGADVICQTSICMDDQVIGAVIAAYRPELLEKPCPLLNYEIKLMDTIAARISQLALSRQRELTLLVNVLRQLDPDILLSMIEKLGVYLERTVGGGASAIVLNLGSLTRPQRGEVNAPTATSRIDTEALARRMIKAAVSYLSQDTVFQLFTEWIHDQRILALVKIVDRKDARISDILNAVKKYTATLSFQSAQSTRSAKMPAQLSHTETWLLSELTHRFLTNDERLINLVLNDMSIPDFEPLIEHIIGSERSMGNVGGKGAGLFIASQILRHAAQSDPLLQDIRTPNTWYIATDQILDFLRYNRLEELNSYKYNSIFYNRMTYENVVAKIKNAKLPPQTVTMLRLVLEDLGESPLIVRSSSLLEDSHNGSFSGKYKSLFLCNRGSRHERLDALMDALLEIYASMYNPDSLQYRKERGLLNFTEQMGVLIQEVVGTKVGKYYLPIYAGVAFARNLLRWSPRIRPEDGLVRLVMGLGTRAVDRVNNDYPVMFAPSQPQLRINQSPEEIRRYSPRHIDVIDLEQGFTTVEATSFLREAGAAFPNLHQYVSVFHDDFLETKNAFTLDTGQDDMVVTLHHALSPSGDFVPKINRMLKVLSEKLQYPVDIEFAYDGRHLYLLQCRSQGVGLMKSPAPIPQNLPHQDILFTANRFVPDGILSELSYLVYVDPDAYHKLPRREDLLAVGEAVGLLNEELPRRKFILIGPGRWGSRGDVKLGVRVTYADISNTAALIEVAREKYAYVPELSFGTHFFQDLVESGIVYLPLYPDQNGVLFRESFFRCSPNQLARILPRYAGLSDVIKVIDIPVASGGRFLSIHMNSELEKAVAFLSSANAPSAEQPDGQAAVTWHNWTLETEQEHWQWRYYMARQIADAMDMEAYGVKGVYLFGSTNTGETGIGSDIDLLIHAEDDPARLEQLSHWLDGWSQALARINFLQTGHDTERLLDVHIVTDEDIAKGNAFAVKINSFTDPATLLRVREPAGQEKEAAADMPQISE